MVRSTEEERVYGETRSGAIRGVGPSAGSARRASSSVADREMNPLNPHIPESRCLLKHTSQRDRRNLRNLWLPKHMKRYGSRHRDIERIARDVDRNTRLDVGGLERGGGAYGGPA